MRRLAGGLARALVALALAGCAVATSPAAPPPSGPSAERPTYALGDRWIRSDGVFEVIRVENDAYVFSKGPNAEVVLSKDLALVRLSYDGGTFEFTPPPRIPWPLRVGAKGSTEGTLRAPYGPNGRVNLDWEVLAHEDVEVPAGKFKAFRISYSFAAPESSNFGGWVQRAPGGAISGSVRTPFPPSSPLKQWLTLYYAPEARQIVRAESTMWQLQFEVVALDPQDTAPLTIAVREPKDQTAVPAADDLKLSATVSGGRGVSRVTVSLNGDTVATQDAEGPPKRTMLLDTRLTLRPGKNVMLITATDPNGTSSQEARTLFYEPRVAVTLPPAGQSLRIGAKYIELSGVVHQQGIDWVTISLNGVEVRTAFTEAGRSEHEITSDLNLEEGRNVIGIRSSRRDATGVTSQNQEERIIVVDRSLPRESIVAVAGDASTTPPAAPPVVAATPPPSATAPALVPPPAALSPPSPVLVASLAPLTVALSSPRDQATVDQETMGLAGLVSGGKGVTRVQVALNGVEISKREEREPQRAMALSLPIRLREGQNTLVVTAVEADGTMSQEVRTVHYERLVPLSVAFRYPQDQARVAEAASIAAAVVTSSRGVASVRVTLNGREVHQQAERTPQKSLLVTAPLVLREGVNTVALTATDAEGAVRHEVRTVTLERPGVAAVAPAPPPPPPASESWAVVVGVGDYESSRIPRLRFSVSDAEAIYQTLIGPAGFKTDHVLLLTDKTERRPTLRNLKWALGTFLARSARKDDTVLMFFAGHGAPEADPRGLERDGLAKYLVPSDADPEDLYATAFPMEELQTIFSRIEAERVVAFLDTCYSGAAGGRTFTARQTRAGTLDELFLERLTRSKGRAIVTASRPSEVSIELPELGHGIFTYYLVEGLKGAADLNRDGIVSLQELYDYIEQKVTQKSRAVGGNQHPVMKGELEGVLPLVKVKP